MGSKPRLADAHVEQIRVLKGEGKSVKEIIEVMEATYTGLKLSPYLVSGALKPVKGVAMAGAPTVKAKRKYHKHAEKKAAAEGSPDQDRAIKDILALLQEIHGGYRQVFSYLRKELIKSRQEVYLMMTGAGIEIPESTIQ